MIRIRVDDFPNTKDDERDKHSLNAFRHFHRVLSECIGNKRYLLGVIPGRCGPDDLLCLRNETDVVVGMHGIFHDEKLLDIYQNEFPAYLTRGIVSQQLKDARSALQAAMGRPVRIYMPPRNKIDLRTLSLLDGAGFDHFTLGPEQNENIAGNYFFRRKIWSMPPHEYGRTDELLIRESYTKLMESSDAGQDVVLSLHWTWETNIGLEHMKAFFAKIPLKYFTDFDA